jgi:hypothetical protein
VYPGLCRPFTPSIQFETSENMVDPIPDLTGQGRSHKLITPWCGPSLPADR